LAGELAAVGTALCWGSSASLFVTSGRRMGSLVLNRLRLTVALVFLWATLWAVRGSPWPSWATRDQLELLAASGVLGFVLGDSLYFRALVILGAGRAALLLSLAPVFAAILARVFLGERLGAQGVLGMAITLVGLAAALRERARETGRNAEGSPVVGALSGAAAALLASSGFVLSKAALHGGLDALSATVIRVGIAVPLAWLLAPVQGGFARSLAALQDRVAVRAMLVGAFLGPFLGVTLSLLALQHAEAGVATSIFACFPLVAILLGARIHHERVTARTLAGALVTIAGVAVLFSRR
jgi:drug/metabolite transporter (DMT)-like permease